MRSIKEQKCIKRIWNDGDVDFFEYSHTSTDSRGRSTYVVLTLFYRLENSGIFNSLGGQEYCYTDDIRFVDIQISRSRLKMYIRKYEKR